MKVVRQLPLPERGPVAVALGNFDGVHRGHQAVLARARECARTTGGEAWVLTFDPHPSRLFSPDISAALLTTPDHKLELLADAGMDGCILHPFTPEFAALPPDEFLQTLVRGLPGLNTVVVGPNWTFGCQARGNVEILRQFAAARGLAVAVAEPVFWRAAPVSSTRIREAVRQGCMEEAREMLARWFSLRGRVVPGRQVGRNLGFPTANLEPRGEIHPSPGIYAAYSIVDGRRLDGALYIGTRSTFDLAHRGFVVEMHFLDVSVDLYSRPLEIFLVSRLRDDRKFDSPAALKAQIAADLAAARVRLAAVH